MDNVPPLEDYAELKEFLRHYPFSPLAMSRLALIQGRYGNEPEAVVNHVFAVEFAPGDFEIRTNYAGFLADSGNHITAVKHLDEAIRIDPSHPAGYLMRADSLAALGRIDDALADMDRVVGLVPTPQAYIHRARLITPQRDPAAVIQDCERAIAIDPTLAEAFVFRGIARTLRKEYSQAIADLSEASRLCPEDPLAIFNRGLAYVYSGEYLMAWTDFDEYVHRQPTDADGYFQRGHASHELANLDGALADFEQAMSLAPSELFQKAINAVRDDIAFIEGRASP